MCHHSFEHLPKQLHIFCYSKIKQRTQAKSSEAVIISFINIIFISVNNGCHFHGVAFIYSHKVKNIIMKSESYVFILNGEFKTLSFSIVNGIIQIKKAIISFEILTTTM